MSDTLFINFARKEESLELYHRWEKLIEEIGITKTKAIENYMKKSLSESKITKNGNI